jgi:proteic killer suppression protein
VVTSFADRETQKVFDGTVARKLPREVQVVAHRKLLLIDSANAIGDLAVPPGNRLEKLHGDREGQWSIRINDQWRICFSFADAVEAKDATETSLAVILRPSNASDVEITDYH